MERDQPAGNAFNDASVTSTMPITVTIYTIALQKYIATLVYHLKYTSINLMALNTLCGLLESCKLSSCRNASILFARTTICFATTMVTLVSDSFFRHAGYMCSGPGNHAISRPDTSHSVRCCSFHEYLSHTPSRSPHVSQSGKTFSLKNAHSRYVPLDDEAFWTVGKHTTDDL